MAILKKTRKSHSKLLKKNNVRFTDSDCNSAFLRTYIRNKDDRKGVAKEFHSYLNVRISNSIPDVERTEYL